MKDKLWIALFALGSLGLLWFGDILLIGDLTNANNETGGFMLIFFSPILIIVTFGVIFQIGKLWLKKA